MWSRSVIQFNVVLSVRKRRAISTLSGSPLHLAVQSDAFHFRRSSSSATIRFAFSSADSCACSPY
jgi:hypothetical protein